MARKSVMRWLVSGAVVVAVLGAVPWATMGVDACGPACGKPWGPNEGPNARRYMPPVVQKPVVQKVAIPPTPRVVIKYPVSNPVVPVPAFAAKPPAPTAPPAPPATAAPQPASACSAAVYLQRRGIVKDAGVARDLRDALLQNGFAQVDGPRENAVAVFQPSYFKNVAGWETEKSDGFAGVIGKVESETQSSVKVTLRGASTTPGGANAKAGDESGCNNLVDATLGPYGKTTSLVVYYVR